MLDPFVLRALLGIIFASFSAPVSTIMLLRGALYMSPEVSHAALGGAALGVLLQVFIPGLADPFLFAIIFCIATSIWISRVGRSSQQALSMMLSVSLALSVMLYAIIRSYLPIEKKIMVDSYLVSDLLLISETEVLNLAIASTISILMTIVFYREFLYICFDMETAESLGLKVGLYDSLLFATSAIAAAVIARTMGVLLSVTLLVIPAAVSRLTTRRVSGMLITSFATTIFSGLCGLALSLHFNIPTGGSIALVSIIIFSLAYLARFIKNRLV
ncbi:MAG: iron chelate uptake ABC transporter family permease subunit [Thermoproteota archaeon]|nr:metal ABC transporter permease [Candidatus Brockarchaeota archaeon]